MTPARPALPPVAALPLMLALAACGSGEGESGSRREGPSAPLGFELAAATIAPGIAAPAAAAEPAMEGRVATVTTADLADRLARGEVRLIDVRTDAEVAEGTIPGAEHIPLDRFDPAMLGPSDHRRIVLYCRSGRRSEVAAERLAAHSGGTAEHLEGGMLAWEAAKLPVSKR